jgi:hypothetical protein
MKNPPATAGFFMRAANARLHRPGCDARSMAGSQRAGKSSKANANAQAAVSQ